MQLILLQSTSTSGKISDRSIEIFWNLFSNIYIFEIILLNISVLINLALDSIDNQVVALEQLVILVFYRAQFKIYRQAACNLSLAQPRMADL